MQYVIGRMVYLQAPILICPHLESFLRRRTPPYLVAVFITAMMFGACATTPPSAQIIRTLYPTNTADMNYRNILVISVIGDYPDRLRFEQQLTAALTTDEATASPYFAVAGRNPRVTRNTINTAIRSRQFDAVLIVRLQGQDVPGAAPGRPTGRNFQLFMYDYDEFNFPASIPLESTLTFVTEFYAAAEQKKLWSIESLSFDHQSVDQVIELHARSIAAQILADGITAN